MGHGFVPSHVANGEAVEALRRMVEYAFTLPEITAVEARNPDEWTEQVSPVIALGFERFQDGRILYKAR